MAWIRCGGHHKAEQSAILRVVRKEMGIACSDRAVYERMNNFPSPCEGEVGGVLPDAFFVRAPLNRLIALGAHSPTRQ